MRVPFRAFALFGALIGCTALWASPAAAQIQLFPTCSVTGDATAPVSITYDPFSSTGLSQATISLVLRRNRGILTARTERSAWCSRCRPDRRCST